MKLDILKARLIIGGYGIGLVALLALACFGCALVNQPPGTFPTPAPGTPPANPSPLCAAGNASECYHRPPGSPWLYNCKGGAPTVTGPAECPPSVTPCVIPDGVEGRDVHRIVPAPAGNPAIAEALRAAIRARRTCPEGDSPRCLVGVSLDEWRHEIVAQLLAHGTCAAVQRGSDEICVEDGPGCQGWRVGTCGQDTAGPGSGCEKNVVVAWPTPGAVRDFWVKGAAPGPTPTPEPTGCPAGTPPPGKYLIDCHVKPANPAMVFCSATPKVVGEREYCAPDLNCPFKGGEGSASRIACERALAWPVWTGAEVRADPFVADAPRGATVSVCARDVPGACSAPTVAP